MKNRVIVNLCDKEYVLLTEEEEDYVMKLAEKVDKLIEDAVYRNMRSTKTDAAILTCLDLCDKNIKLTEANDNMRNQIKNYVDEIATMNKKLSKLEKAEAVKSE